MILNQCADTRDCGGVTPTPPPPPLGSAANVQQTYDVYVQLCKAMSNRAKICIILMRTVTMPLHVYSFCKCLYLLSGKNQCMYQQSVNRFCWTGQTRWYEV